MSEESTDIRYVDADELLRKIDRLLILGEPQRNYAIYEVERIILSMLAGTDVTKVKRGAKMDAKENENGET